MEKLSVLIFSRNDVDKALGLIRDIYSIASEIVLLDSSDKAGKAKLAREKKRLRKLSVFNVMALGYPDPLRMYGLSKCRNEWVFLIDTDERISDSIKAGLGDILEGAKCSAYAIKRYEEVEGSSLPSLFTWQIRLFKRSKVAFHGNLHEQPRISGALHRLDGRYYMEHRLELMHHTRKGAREYAEMRMFDRFTYREYNERVARDADRLSLGSQKASALSRFAGALLRSYEIITFRDLDREISLFDYRFYFFSIEFVFGLRERSIRDMFGAWGRASEYVEKYRHWISAPDADENFAIAQIINRIGVTKFLGFDSNKTVDDITEKYSGKEQGVTLLIALLKRRYEGKEM